MIDLSGAVQAAIYTALSAIEGLPPVVSETPIDDQDMVQYPFVLLGDDQVTEEGGKTSRTERHLVAIHVAMAETTKKVVRGWQEAIRAALHNQPIAADGAILSPPRAQDWHTPEVAPGIYLGTQTYLILAQPAD